MPLSEREYMRDPARTRAEQQRGNRWVPSLPPGGRWLMGQPAADPDRDASDASGKGHHARDPVRPWSRVLRFVLVVVGFGVAAGIAASIVIPNLS